MGDLYAVVDTMNEDEMLETEEDFGSCGKCGLKVQIVCYQSVPVQLLNGLRIIYIASFWTSPDPWTNSLNHWAPWLCHVYTLVKRPFGLCRDSTLLRLQNP